MWIGLASLFTANLISGSLNSVLVKLGVREIPPLTFTMLRFFMATLILLPFYLKQPNKKISSKHAKSMFAQGFFFASNVGIFSIAMQFTSAIMSQIIYVFIPIVVGIISYFFLKERFTRNKVIGSTLAFLGVSFLIGQSIVKADILSFGTLYGNLMILVGVFAFSGYFLFSQKLSKFYSPTTITFFTFLITFILLLAMSPFELSIRPLLFSDITAIGIGSLFGLAIFSSAIQYSLIQVGIKKTGAFTASLFQYLAPFFTIISATIILKERATLSIIMGGLLIMFGVFYATAFNQIVEKLFPHKMAN